MNEAIDVAYPYMSPVWHAAAAAATGDASVRLPLWLDYGWSALVFYTFGAWFFYLACASASYYYFFVRHRAHYFPRKIDLPDAATLRKQVREEITLSMLAIPVMAALTAPISVLVHMGYSKVYSNVHDHDGGWLYLASTVVTFLLWSDCLIYWIHRWLHIPIVYKWIHKRHHAFRVTTPFSSHAFHPFDGWAQSVPYFLYGFFWPINSKLLLLLFVVVNVWTVSIHDRVVWYKWVGYGLNSAPHHDIHHRDFNYNYGQYTTFWDVWFGTYRDPTRVIKDKKV